MPKRIVFVVVLALAVAAAAGVLLRRARGEHYYTGYVEGEERVLRAEVAGRVLEVAFVEGDVVPADAVVARLDDRDVQSRLASKRQELAVIDADLRTGAERVMLVESTWQRDLSARAADVRQAEAAAELAVRTLGREQDLGRTGASTAQLLDEAHSRRDQAVSARDRAREVFARTQAEERQIALARQEVETLRQRRALVEAQLAELEVLASKYAIHAPSVPTVVQTQLIWPGELAQPGAGVLAVLDPRDKYVQVYVPVADVGALHVGRKVAFELDSAPGRRLAGEVSFVADQATFTPEKIETRSDRMAQVYRAKVRIRGAVEQLQPGTEGNVYLLPEEPPA